MKWRVPIFSTTFISGVGISRPQIYERIKPSYRGKNGNMLFRIRETDGSSQRRPSTELAADRQRETYSNAQLIICFLIT